MYVCMYVFFTSGDVCLSNFRVGIFCAASAASFILFLDNMFFSTKRWRQLRSGAGSLESIIWYLDHIFVRMCAYLCLCAFVCACVCACACACACACVYVRVYV